MYTDMESVAWMSHFSRKKTKLTALKLGIGQRRSLHRNENERKEDGVSNHDNLVHGRLTWDTPLYAVNMSYHHWLIKKLI